MVTVSPVSDSQLSGYYVKDDYYFKMFKDSLVVFGQGAKDKNLGAVKTMEQKKFFDSLVKSRDVKAQDITFSAPKSLSIMWAVGTEEQRNLALYVHRTAIEKAMAHIEEHLFNIQKKSNNIVKTYKGSGMVALGIDHSVSRPTEENKSGEYEDYQDPQIHTHVLLANAGYIEGDLKKVNRSVNYNQIYKNQKQIDRIYKMYARREFEKVNCKTRKTENGFELLDISDAQNRHFSNRSIQIEGNLAKKHLTRRTATGAQKNAAALKGRLKKLGDDKAAPGSMSDKWKSKANAVDININWEPFDEELDKRNLNDVRQVIKKGFQAHVAINPISTRGKAIHDIFEFAELAHEENPANNPLVDLDDIHIHLKAIMEEDRMIRLPGQKEEQRSSREQFVSINLMVAGCAFPHSHHNLGPFVLN